MHTIGSHPRDKSSRCCCPQSWMGTRQHAKDQRWALGDRATDAAVPWGPGIWLLGMDVPRQPLMVQANFLGMRGGMTLSLKSPSWFASGCPLPCLQKDIPPASLPLCWISPRGCLVHISDLTRPHSNGLPPARRPISLQPSLCWSVATLPFWLLSPKN